jgi:hypothetical protein
MPSREGEAVFVRAAISSSPTRLAWQRSKRTSEVTTLTHVNFRLPADEARVLQQLAYTRGTNFSAEIRRAVRLLIALG